jgi:hypothetical protein
MYQDDVNLLLRKSILITVECHTLLRQEKRRLKKEEGRKVSMAKLVCNLILQAYCLEDST